MQPLNELRAERRTSTIPLTRTRTVPELVTHRSRTSYIVASRLRALFAGTGIIRHYAYQIEFVNQHISFRLILVHSDALAFSRILKSGDKF